MQRTSTPTLPPDAASDSGRRCRRHLPRATTLERIRQFARAYQVVRPLPSQLSGIVLN